MTITSRGRSYLRPQAWQVATGPGDGRWGRQAPRYAYMNAQCRYCGTHCQGQPHSVTAHPRAECLACGTPQCDNSRECIVCMIGFVGRVPWSPTPGYRFCGYAHCMEPAVAKASRVGRCCAGHLARARGARGTLAAQIADAEWDRELGGQPWQKLAWFGPQRRYAVRRWHDDGRTGWTTGQDPEGFETAGAADREASAWNDPRTSDGWHAERVVLTDEVRGAIEGWQVQPSGG